MDMCSNGQGITIFTMFAPKCISEPLSKKRQSKRQPNTTTKEFVGKPGHVRTILLLPFWKECFPLDSKNHNNNKESTTQGGPKSNKNKTKIKQRDSRQTSTYIQEPPKKKSGAANDPSDTCGKSYSEYLTCLPCAVWFAQMTIY